MNEFDDLTPNTQESIVQGETGNLPSPMAAPHPSAAEKSAKHTRRVFLFKGIAWAQCTRRGSAGSPDPGLRRGAPFPQG